MIHCELCLVHNYSPESLSLYYGIAILLLYSMSPPIQLMLVAKKVELESLMEELNRCIASKPSPPRESMCPGMLCAAQYSVDRRWYRAAVSHAASPQVSAFSQFL